MESRRRGGSRWEGLRKVKSRAVAEGRIMTHPREGQAEMVMLLSVIEVRMVGLPSGVGGRQDWGRGWVGRCRCR